MASTDEQKRESAEHTEIDEKKAGIGVDDYVENPEVDRRITLKTDLHILPWIFILWLLAFIDRSNIGRVVELEEEVPSFADQLQEMRKSMASKTTSISLVTASMCRSQCFIFFTSSWTFRRTGS